MKLLRVGLLFATMVCSALVGILIMGLGERPNENPNVDPPAAQQILVASHEIAAGENLADKISWANWPITSVQAGYVTKSSEPDAINTFSVRRSSARIYAGDPIRREYFQRDIKSPMAGVLSAGKRAVAVKIAVDTSAGGFILPNDFADVIMSRRQDDGRGAKRELSSVTTQSSYITETILENVKVLAIDQSMQEDGKGGKVMVGQTATLELTPSQAEIITAAQEMSTRLTLALRASADTTATNGKDADHLVFSPSYNNTVRVVSGGAITEYGATNR